MIGTCVFAAVALVITGAVIGVLAVVKLGIHHEEPADTLTDDVPDRLARGARRESSMYAHGAAMASQRSHYRHNTWPTGRSRGDHR